MPERIFPEFLGQGCAGGFGRRVIFSGFSIGSRGYGTACFFFGGGERTTKVAGAERQARRRSRV